jgi:hypothetical protein
MRVGNREEKRAGSGKMAGFARPSVKLTLGGGNEEGNFNLQRSV